MAKILSFRGQIHIASLLKVFCREYWTLNHIEELSMKVLKLGKSEGVRHYPQTSLLCTLLCWWASGLGLRRGPYRLAHFSFQGQVQIQPQQ